MVNRLLAVVAMVTLAAAVGAMDYSSPGAVSYPTYDDEGDAATHLMWDNGTRSYSLCFYTGRGYWVGNDFDVSTLTTYREVRAIRIYTGDGWPNGQWDGFAIALFRFSGGGPGNMIWGPKYVKANTAGEGWKAFNVNWMLPSTMTSFVAAMKQGYYYPNCDPYAVDTNTTFLGHSWKQDGNSWQPFNTTTLVYRNVMMRVTVAEDTTGVSPSSFGRVKALYH